MYKGKNHHTGYCYQYYWRDRRRREAKRALIFLIKICMLTLMSILVAGFIILAVFLGSKLHLKRVYASEDTALLEEETVVVSESQDEVNFDLADQDVWVEERKTPVVFLDAGHGGEDAGCSDGGIEEKTINLEIAKRVQKNLMESGFEVIMSRESDIYIAKEDRVMHANDTAADIYVSIHQNAAEEGDGISGMEVWYDGGSDAAQENGRLARLIMQQTGKSTEAVERELRGDADFHVTGNTSMPSCLIETGFLSDSQERSRLVDSEYQEKIAAGIAQGIEYYFYPKTMYLTFDDGPSPENTEKVLDILKERGIRATFFLVGENVARYPDIARRIAEEGHTIGIHSNTHDYIKIYADTDSFLQDFEAAHQIVYDVTGIDAKLFRFPGGSVNDYNTKVSGDIIEKMSEMGYIYYDWNASLEDAVGNASPQELVANGAATTLGRKNVVMLAHDVVYNTGICLNDLLDSLPEYEMKALDEDSEPVQF